MKIITQFKDGIIPQKYSKNAPEKNLLKGSPIVSFPFELENVPVNTESLAWTLIDYDAIPVCGFPWIHWEVANADPNVKSIPEDFSRTSLNIVQGKNSFVSGLLNEDFSEIDHHYVGPTPPDQDHVYYLKAYALDTILDLEEGFFLNQFYKAIEGHVIEETEIKLIGLK